MNKAFICYRRDECQDIVERLNDRLYTYFGPDTVFLDTHAIPPGMDFRRYIDRQFDKCGVLLLVIGRTWLTSGPANAPRHIDEITDYVRIEVELALERNIPVIPLLVHGAKVPSSSELPDSIKRVSYQNAIDLPCDPGFHLAVNRIIRALEQFGIEPPKEPIHWEYFLIPCGITLVLIGSSVATSGLITLLMSDSFPSSSVVTTRILWIFFGGTLPLGLGPLAIVFGKRICCQRKASERGADYPGSESLLPRPKSNSAVASLGLGIASLAWSIVVAVPAVIIGCYAIFDIGRRPTWVRGRSLAIQGIVFAVLGSVISGFYFRSVWEVYRAYRDIDVATKEIERKDYDAAIFRLNECVKELPKHGTGFLQRGIAKFRAGHREQESLEDLSKAIERFRPLASNPYGFSFLSNSQRNSKGLYDQLLAQAYLARADLYDTLNENANATADRSNAAAFQQTPAPLESSFESEPLPPAPAPPQ